MNNLLDHLTPEQREQAESVIKAGSTMEGLLQWMMPSGHPDYLYGYAKHHEVMAREFERILRGENDKLIIELPPGSAKSTLLRQFITLFILYNLDKASLPILRISATQNLVERQGRILRSVYEEPRFKELAGFGLDPNLQALAHFGLTNGTTVTSAGIGSSIVGIRAALGIIDDPVSGFEEMMSEDRRRFVYEWYISEFASRLLPNAPRIIVMTRWHFQDLVGFILNSDDAPNWTVVRIPMECEDEDDPLEREMGEMLWTDWYTPQQIEDAKRLPEVWAGLYQQRPFTEEGDFLCAEDIEIVDDVPKELGLYASLDLALTERQTADATVIIPAGVDKEGTLYILGLSKERCSPEKTLEKLEKMHDYHKFRECLIEDSPAEKVFKELAHKYFRQRRRPLPLMPMPTRGKDKMSRAQAFRGLAKMGGVKMLRGPWNNDIIKELVEFPFGKHDDIVDALALLGRRAAKMSGNTSQADYTPKEFQGTMQEVKGRAYTTQTLGDLFADHDRGRKRRRSVRI
jgi:predicted phage terminase large subunit-like protein